MYLDVANVQDSVGKQYKTFRINENTPLNTNNSCAPCLLLGEILNSKHAYDDLSRRRAHKHLRGDLNSDCTRDVYLLLNCSMIVTLGLTVCSPAVVNRPNNRQSSSVTKTMQMLMY